jgi:acyl carrier protein
MDNQDSTAVLKEFILKRFPAARHASFGNDDPLLESGLVDSMGILEIVAFLEKQFGISVTDEELTPENFQSLNSLSGFVGRKCNMVRTT